MAASEKVPRAPRKRPIQERSKETVAAILQGAARVLQKEGYGRATTNRIAEAAGVSVGSLYEYFPNKEAIFTQLRRRLNRDMFGSVSETMLDVLDLPVAEAARRTVEVMVAAHAVDPSLQNALRAEVPDRALADQQHKIEDGLYRLSTHYMAQHQAELRRPDGELAAFVAVNAIAAVVHAASLHCPERLEDGSLTDELSDLLTRYLAAD